MKEGVHKEEGKKGETNKGEMERKIRPLKVLREEVEEEREKQT